MGGRGASSGGIASRLKPIQANPNWAYQPDDQTDLRDMKKNPIPFVGVGEDMRLAELFEDGTRQTAYESDTPVNISELKTLQPFVLGSGITDYKSWDGSTRPYVVEYEGQKYVIDGNHRIARAKLEGQKTINVDVSYRIDK